MPWDVAQTVLTSVFGCTIFVFCLYGIHFHLLPHLRQPADRPDITIPQAERPASRRLRDSLYSLPSTNFIDPRNSIADTELMNSRWSTSLHDLDPHRSVTLSGSPKFLFLPRSPCMHFGSSQQQTLRSLGFEKRTSRVGKACVPPQDKTLKLAKSTQALDHSHQTQTSPKIAPDIIAYERFKFGRLRSKSDTLVVTHQGLLAQSHLAFYDRKLLSTLQSPTNSDFSGTTLLSPPQTPAQQIIRCDLAGTSPVVSPTRHGRPRQNNETTSQGPRS